MKKPAQLFLRDMPEYYGLDSRTNYTAHENKTKLGIHPVFSHKKKSSTIPKEWLCKPTWLSFHCFGAPIQQP